MIRRILYDLAALIARVAVGVVFVAHGWQKYQSGAGRVTAQFTQMGIPQPRLAATFATWTELLGGGALIVGFLTPLAGLALFAIMVGAFWFVHMKNGVFVADNGYELVAALGAASLLLAIAGAGRLSLDSLIFRRRKKAGAIPPVTVPQQGSPNAADQTPVGARGFAGSPNLPQEQPKPQAKPQRQPQDAPPLPTGAAGDTVPSQRTDATTPTPTTTQPPG